MTRSRGWAAALVAVAILSALWWLRREPDAPAVSVENVAGSEERAAAPEAATKPAERVVEAPERAETPLSGDRESWTVEGELRVRAVAHGTFEPVPAAEMLWWPALGDAANANLEILDRLMNSGTARTLLASAQRAVADANGVATVGDARHGVVVLARTEGWLGIAQFVRVESPPLTVVMQRDFALVAHVVDETGAPAAGLAVALRTGGEPREQPELRETSDAEGIARFEHAGFALARWGGGSETAWLVLDELVEPVVEYEFSLDTPPTESVTLIAASGGSCEVRILGGDGAPVQGVFEVVLGYSPGEDVELDELDPSWLVGARRRSHDGAPVNFRCVQTERELIASVVPLRGGAVQRAPGGPLRSAADKLAIDVKLGERGLRLAGRALAPDGAVRAAANVELRLVLEGQQGGITLAPVQPTLADGSFEFEVEPSAWIPDAELSLALVERAADGSELASGLRTLSASPHDSRVELGDFVLEPLAIFASGRVVSAELAPVCGAWVLPSLRHSEPGENYLEPLTELRVRTDELGRFALRAPSFAQLELAASKEQLRSATVRASAGTTDLQLVLAPRAELAGRLVVDPSLPLSRLFVIATPRVPSADGWESELRVRPEPDGRFVVRGVAPGEYSVSVRAVDGYALLGQVDGVIAIAGERTSDARLDPLDLRMGHRTVTVRIVDERGEPFGGELAVLVRRVDAEGEHIEYAPLSRGAARLLVGERAPSVTVTAAGHSTQFLGEVSEDRVVTLLPAPKLRFTLTGDCELPKLPYLLTLQLRPAVPQPKAVTWNLPQPEFGGDGVARCEGILTGNVQVTLHVVRRTADAWGETEVPLERPLVIDVRERGEQAFEVACKPDALARALQALGAR